ncbi:MAG TPA: bifunctional oligoribonuclease/PAP phosphatase NrnA [Fluviicola sp.]|nr:bifunctional oligoribonuclease/PAP phosphatase NrnA [Fluviicola sp.]
MSEAQSILSALQTAGRIVIVSHKSPDGDSVGSSLALYQLLKKWGKNAHVVHPDAAPDFLHWVPGQPAIVAFDERTEEAKQLLAGAEVICCLDFNEPGRVGKEMQPFLEQAPALKIMIDHHLNPSDFCRFRISETSACSTAQLLYEWMEEAGILADLDAAIGTCIYLGIMTDTGSFRFPSVNPKTHLILAHLMEAGVIHYEIHEQIYDTNTIDRIRLRGYALSEKLVCLDKLPIAYISLSAEELERFHYRKGDTEGLVNQVLGISGIQMAALFVEKDGAIKISFRSKGDYKVNELAAAHFEGGGHGYASGGISFTSMEETISKFVTNVHQFIPVA